MNTGLKIRAAWPDEVSRIRELLENQSIIPNDAGFLVAVKESGFEPIQCLISWWPGKSDSVIEFIPQSASSRPIAPEILELLLRELIRLEGEDGSTFKLVLPLADAHPLVTTLEKLGFARSYTERVFQLPFWKVRERIQNVYSKLSDRIKHEWKTSPLTAENAHWAMTFLAEKKLMKERHFHQLWHRKNGLDKKRSSIVFFAGQPVGVLIVSRQGDVLNIAALAADKAAPTFFSNLFLLHEFIKDDGGESPTVVHFRAGETVHQSTIRSAKRFDAIESSPLHFFKK